MNVLIYCSPKIDDLNWIEDKITEFLYLAEEECFHIWHRPDIYLEYNNEKIADLIERYKNTSINFQENSTEIKNIDLTLILINKSAILEQDQWILEECLQYGINCNFRNFSNEDELQYLSFK